ncbi:MAG: RimK family alpha-L-glutamate ligase [Rhodospirillales bacterium]
MRTIKRIAIFGERPQWHANRLRTALAARGADGVCVSLGACSIDTGAGAHGLDVPGFRGELPDGALVRAISAGSFEQVTLRLGLLHALHDLGVPVCNDARAIERCVDKSTTTFLLSRAGIATPSTWVCESPEHARAVAAREIGAGRPLVLKPLFGAQGRGLHFLDDASRLPEPDEVAGVYYLQRYVDSGAGAFRDWRVFVVGGRAVAAMIRHGARCITTVGPGARWEGAAPDGEVGALAVAAADAVGAGFAGVDIIRDGAGRPQVLEVNSMPAWQGLQGVTRVDLAQEIADDFLARLPTADTAPVAARRAGAR